MVVKLISCGLLGLTCMFLLSFTLAGIRSFTIGLDRSLILFLQLDCMSMTGSLQLMGI
jgi:hypothetical protein